MRVVIDTNIIVSALLNSNGKPATFMRRVFGCEYEVIVTERILDEYKDVLYREKFPFTDEMISYIIGWFRSNALLVEIKEDDYSSDEVPDPTDAVFYITARATRAKLITGNIRHYPVTEYRTMLWEVC